MRRLVVALVLLTPALTAGVCAEGAEEAGERVEREWGDGADGRGWDIDPPAPWDLPLPPVPDPLDPFNDPPLPPIPGLGGLGTGHVDTGRFVIGEAPERGAAPAIPEPSAGLLFTMGLVTFAAHRRYRRTR